MNVPLLVLEFPNALFIVYCITGYYQTKGGAAPSRERGVSEREGEEEEEQVHLCGVEYSNFTLDIPSWCIMEAWDIGIAMMWVDSETADRLCAGWQAYM